MHADYVPNPLYDNNPFIEALPPMLSGKDLMGCGITSTRNMPQT